MQPIAADIDFSPADPSAPPASDLIDAMVAEMRPGTVLVDDRIATELATGSGFEMTALPARELHGLGPVTPWTLRRAADPARRGRTDEGDA